MAVLQKPLRKLRSSKHCYPTSQIRKQLIGIFTCEEKYPAVRVPTN